MKTLNEQIERLRAILHTCYASIARKGGTLPPIGERNMTNLPDAVESVPQVVGAKLEELTITANGTYTPQEGVYGFSKVVARVVPTKRVVIPNGMRVTNDLIVDGYWAGELVDTSKMTNMSNMFNNCQSLQYLDVSNWDVSKVTTMQSIFYDCSQLQTLINNRTIDDVLANNISALNGLKVALSLSYTILDRASLRAVINGLADLTGQTTQTLTLGLTLMAKLTEEDIAIATNKNWTLS